MTIRRRSPDVGSIVESWQQKAIGTSDDELLIIKNLHALLKIPIYRQADAVTLRKWPPNVSLLSSDSPKIVTSLTYSTTQLPICSTGNGGFRNYRFHKLLGKTIDLI